MLVANLFSCKEKSFAKSFANVDGGVPISIEIGTALSTEPERMHFFSIQITGAIWPSVVWEKEVINYFKGKKENESHFFYRDNNRISIVLQFHGNIQDVIQYNSNTILLKKVKKKKK